MMGSKNAKDDDGAEGENAEHPEAADAEAATEKPDGEPAAAPAAEESKGEEATKDVEMATEDQKEEEEEDDNENTHKISPETKHKKNKQRVLLLSSRGVTHRMRHLMNDLETLLPHVKKGNQITLSL